MAWEDVILAFRGSERDKCRTWIWDPTLVGGSKRMERMVPAPGVHAHSLGEELGADAAAQGRPKQVQPVLQVVRRASIKQPLRVVGTEWPRRSGLLCKAPTSPCCLTVFPWEASIVPISLPWRHIPGLAGSRLSKTNLWLQRLRYKTSLKPGMDTTNDWWIHPCTLSLLNLHPFSQLLMATNDFHFRGLRNSERKWREKLCQSG